MFLKLKRRMRILDIYLLTSINNITFKFESHFKIILIVPKWVKTKQKFAKDCYSTISPALFEEEDNTLVIEKCVVPELHNLQGVVNHLFGTD